MKLFDREPDAPVPAAPLPAEPAPGIENGVATREDDAKMETKTETTRTTTPAVGSRETLSVIGKTLFVKGQIEAAEDMLVEGRLEGTVKHTADRLIIGVSGVVNADIDAKNLIIEGTVEGNIVGAESVVITDSADVRGNVYTARISIADGARFSGTVDMDISKSPKH
ncbi:MAG: polymer-forming cytoskeletal protein [Pseudomonadales bacterium]|jgi:cytoskeletal protein CcmA (bactofilin family)